MQPRTIPLEAWRRAPLLGKVMYLAKALTEGEQGLTAVAKLLGLVVAMAAYLSPEARIAIADQMRSEADTLAPPFDRRALH